MIKRILVPTDLSAESNSILPHAITWAQAFHSRLYLLHVMDPATLQEPERLEALPRVSPFFAVDRDGPGLPPLKRSVMVGKDYRYARNVPATIVRYAREKQADLICLATTDSRLNLAWWSAGPKTESVLEHAPCPVLCLRGHRVRSDQWRRPRYRQVLLLTELDGDRPAHVQEILPFLRTFGGVLHLAAWSAQAGRRPVTPSWPREFGAPPHFWALGGNRSRLGNLVTQAKRTPVDLIVMSPRSRSGLGHRLLSDVFIRLLRETGQPILVLR